MQHCIAVTALLLQVAAMRLKSVDIGSAYFADQPHAACMPCVKLKHQGGSATSMESKS